MNTITRYRKESNLTEQELADLSGVTRDYIVKLEQTMYTTPSYYVVKVLSDFTYANPKDIFDEYEMDYNSKPIEFLSRIQDAELPPWNQIYREIVDSQRHPHIVFRRLVFGHYGLPESQIKYAKLLGIHPAVLSKYELGKTPYMPSSVHDALKLLSTPVDLIQTIDLLAREFHYND